MGEKSSEKKRKRVSDKHDRPSKKAAINSSSTTLAVTFIENDNAPAPIIVTTTGISLPDSLTLNSYHKPRNNGNKTTIKNSDITSSELLLHSSAHPKLDYTATEGGDRLDTLRNHYVAIHDPKRNTLQVVEARKLTMRATLREARTDSDDEDSDGQPSTAFQKRVALTEAFGTTKARKSVQSLAENAHLSSASGGPNAVESALLASMPKEAVSGEQTVDQQIQASKPLPQANLAAKNPADVYSVESLIPGGLNTLQSMPVQDWQEAIASKEMVKTTSRFVSYRLEAVGQTGDVTLLRLLRYIFLLIEFAVSLKPSKGAGRNAKKLPMRDELKRKLSETTNPAGSTEPQFVTDSFIDSLRRRFVPQGAMLNKNDITLLHTTICALSLHIPPASGYPHGANELVTDPVDLGDDLRLDPNQTSQYFRELGCRIDKPKESEFSKWGVKTKTEAGMKKIARLKLPVEFPKVKHGRRK